MKTTAHRLLIKPDTPPTCLEIADAAAYLAWMTAPSDETERAWMAAWTQLCQQERMTGVTRCQSCGMNRDCLLKHEPCRQCGEPKE